MCFTGVGVFRAAIRKHSIDEGRSLIFPANNQTIVQVKCKNPHSRFYVFASKQPEDDTLQIKSIFFAHDCIREKKVVQGDARFLVTQYGSKMKSNPKWSVKSMTTEIRGECKVEFSKYQLYRAKKKEIVLENGDEKQQYALLRRYAKEILVSNPGSTVKIKLKQLGDKTHFKRMYICWGALKRGMMDGCRKVICLDGCHLKTECGGILLTSIGVDANNTMYSFAYAVVEKEKKKSWHWFLSLLKSDLSITNCEEWTLMSDKQKGLIDSVSEIFSGCEHRFCVMHLYSNFKLSYKGLALKDLLRRAARSTRVVDFNKVMQELKERDVKAYEWLASRPPQNWSIPFQDHFKM